MSLQPNVRASTSISSLKVTLFEQTRVGPIVSACSSLIGNWSVGTLSCLCTFRRTSLGLGWFGSWLIFLMFLNSQALRVGARRRVSMLPFRCAVRSGIGIGCRALQAVQERFPRGFQKWYKHVRSCLKSRTFLDTLSKSATSKISSELMRTLHQGQFLG